MPRKRMIDPYIWDDEKFNNLCIESRLLFIGLFSLADDEGRLEGSVRYLRKKIFGYDLAFTEENVSNWLSYIEEKGMVQSYSVNGSSYIFVKNFTNYQTINHPTPSKLPAPEGYIPPEKPVKHEKEAKETHAKNVTFTDEEYKSLIAKFGEAKTKQYIERLSLYKQSTGKAYKSDYATILNWEKRDTDKNGEELKLQGHAGLQVIK